MKIVITSTGDSIENNLDIRFGRCAYFMFYDTESKECELAPNVNRDLDEKAGFEAVHFIKSKGVEKAVSGVFGIKIKSLMIDAGIQMITFQREIKVREIISLLNHNQIIR